MSIYKLNALYLTVFCIIGVFAFAAGIILTNHVDLFFNETYSAQDLQIAQVLMLVLTINICISFPAPLFTSYISSQERFIFQNTISMVSSIMIPIVNILILCIGFRSVGMVIASTTISISVALINAFYCIMKLRMKFVFNGFNFQLLKEIFVFTIFIAVNQIIDQINWQTDKVVLAKVVNGTSVAIYAVGAHINTIFTSFSTAVSNVFAPKVNMIVSNNNPSMIEELTALFTKVGRIQFYIFSLILSGFVLFGKFFIIKWAGDEYVNAYYVSVLLMAPAVVPLIQNIGIEIQRAEYKHKFRSIVYFFMAVINVVITVFLSRIWHEIGAAIGTTISLILANGVVMNIYYHKQCDIDIIYFWKSILRTIKGMIIPIAFGCLFLKFYTLKSYVDFSLVVILYTAVYAISLFYFSFNEDERKLVVGLKNKVLKRR